MLVLARRMRAPSRRLMMRTRFLLLAAGSLLGVPALLAAQRGQPVNFKFAWKPGIVADVRSVTAVAGMNPTAPGDTSATIIRSTRRMTVERHPQGLAMRNAPVAEGGEPATSAVGTMAAAIGAQGEHTVVLSTTGRFVALGDTARLKKTLDSTLAAQPNIGALPPSMRASLEKAMSISAMEATMRQGWESETGQFLSRSWTVGDEVVTTLAMPFQMVPGQMISTTQRTVVIAIAPCDDAAPAVRCAVFKRTLVMDPASMRAALMEMFKAAGMDTSNPDIAAAIPVSSTEIVADGVLEIETLLPRRLSQRVVSNTVAGGISRRTEVTTVLTYTYTSR